MKSYLKLIFCLAITFSHFTFGAPEKSAPTGEEITLSGFKVFIGPEAKDHPKLKDTLKHLKEKIEEALTLAPKVSALSSKVTFWLTHSKKHTSPVYHVSADWLSQNGRDVRMEKGIEIPSLDNFLAWNVPNDQPALVIHELSHAYHDLVLGYENKDIQAAFRAMKLSGAYEKVRYHTEDGAIMRAYALNSEQEYFAELSEAYFHKNDYFPFTKTDIQSFDQRGYQLMQRMWADK